MAGQGRVVAVKNSSEKIVVGHVWDKRIPAECKSNPFIFRLDAKSTWVIAKEPLHEDIDTRATNGIGPGMPFANEVLKKDSSWGEIGLIPCAISGTTSMARWARGTPIYNQMMMRAAAALKSGGQIRALLWYQGESDAAEDSDGSFADDVRRFFTSVRDDLCMPRLHIVHVALPWGVKGKFIKEVRNSQLGLRLPFLSTVDAKGLKLMDDALYLNTFEQVLYLQMNPH